jgi:hypothetical protein
LFDGVFFLTFLLLVDGDGLLLLIVVLVVGVLLLLILQFCPGQKHFLLQLHTQKPPLPHPQLVVHIGM